MTVRRANAGFTLLEILLALVLLALLMAGTWGIVAGATRVTHAADAVMAQSEQVRTVQQLLRRYVAAAVAQLYVPAPGAMPRTFDGDATALTYVAPLPYQSGHAGLYVQTIGLGTGADRHTLRLVYRPYAPRANARARHRTRHVLLRDVAAAHFQYLAATGFGTPPAWRDDWHARNGLPLAVRIELARSGRQRVTFPPMVIPIRAGTGFGSSPGGAR